MTEQFVRKMEEGVKLLGIQLSEKQLEQFYDYFQFLVEKNKVMNLTAITEEDAVITKHFCDSLCLVKGFSDIEKTVSLIDVGTGAGFPGIPLKITFPHLKVTLLDSLNKRVRFLEEVCERLDLENVTCVHARAEDGGRNKDLREKFDLCVSRAVANLSSLSEYCMPFVKVGGYFVPSGSFPGSPAFLGYFAEIGFIFLILIRLLDPSPPGSSNPVTFSISPPNIATAFFA